MLKSLCGTNYPGSTPRGVAILNTKWLENQFQVFGNWHKNHNSPSLARQRSLARIEVKSCIIAPIIVAIPFISVTPPLVPSHFAAVYALNHLIIILVLI